MGGNGAGKSAWKRDNDDRLSRQYFDEDSIARGIADWNSENARLRTRRIVDREIAQAIEDRQDFGIAIRDVSRQQTENQAGPAPLNSGGARRSME